MSQKLKITKIEKLFFMGFRALRNFLEQKPNIATFQGKGEGGVCMS